MLPAADEELEDGFPLREELDDDERLPDELDDDERLLDELDDDDRLPDELDDAVVTPAGELDGLSMVDLLCSENFTLDPYQWYLEH